MGRCHSWLRAAFPCPHVAATLNVPEARAALPATCHASVRNLAGFREEPKPVCLTLTRLR